MAHPVYCRKTEQVYPSAEVASKALSIFRSSISRAAGITAAGGYRTAGGSQWAYADQIPTGLWPTQKVRTEYPVGFRDPNPVVSYDPINGETKHFAMLAHVEFMSRCSHQLISRAAKRTRKRQYALAKERQWAYLWNYEEEGFVWPKPTKRIVCVSNRRVMSASLKCFDNLYGAAESIHASASGIQKAINLTLEGVFYCYHGEQWVWASVFNKPDFCWPFPRLKGKFSGKLVIRSDGERFESLSKAAQSMGCTSSAICNAAKITSIGLHMVAKGYQWAYRSDFDKPGFEWPNVSTRGTRKMC